MKKLNAILMMLLIAGSAMAQTTWNLDKNHSKVGFSIPHMAVSEVDGTFRDFEGTVVTKSDDFNGAEVNFTAKVGSIDTDNERRDGHLKSAEIFDAEKFPEIAFKGNLVKDGGKYKLKGTFTMKGVSKPAEFDVVYNGTMDSGRGIVAGFKLTGKINRQEYGVTYGGKTPGGELVLGDVVDVVAKIEVGKKA
jgi:polyisoprenoid-binding protein YceI